MKTLVAALLLFGFFLGSQSAVFFKSQPEISGHPGECYDIETNTFYKPGEEMIWRGNECARKLCNGPYKLKKILTEIHTCGKIVAPPDCIVSNNSEEKYPDCCKVICPPNNEQTNTDHVEEPINEKIKEQTHELSNLLSK